MSTKSLKQPTDCTCVHTVLAMITNTSVDYVIDWLSNSSAVGAEDQIIFLAHHGIYLATYVQPHQDGTYLALTENEVLNVDFPIAKHPAIITVESERFEGRLHVIYWDGFRVHDPSPAVTEQRTLESYKVVEYWPIMMTAQRLSQILGR